MHLRFREVPVIQFLVALTVFTMTVFAQNASALTATCSGKVQRSSLYFEAHGNLVNKSKGRGFVKINNRVVAEFQGAEAKVNYLAYTFSIRNDRGDVVRGKLNSVRSGASTVTLMDLPGEGVHLVNVPVICTVR